MFNAHSIAQNALEQQVFLIFPFFFISSHLATGPTLHTSPSHQKVGEAHMQSATTIG